MSIVVIAFILIIVAGMMDAQDKSPRKRNYSGSDWEQIEPMDECFDDMPEIGDDL